MAEVNGYYEGKNNLTSALYVYRKPVKTDLKWFYTWTEGDYLRISFDSENPIYGPFDTRTAAVRDAMGLIDN